MKLIWYEGSRDNPNRYHAIALAATVLGTAAFLLLNDEASVPLMLFCASIWLLCYALDTRRLKRKHRAQEAYFRLTGEQLDQ